MSYLEKIRDTITAEVLKTYLPWLLPLLSTLLVGLVPKIRHTLLSLPPSWLLGLLAISLLANFGAATYILVLKRRAGRKTKKVDLLPSDLSDIEIQILLLIAEDPDCTTETFTLHFNTHLERIRYCRDELKIYRYIDYGFAPNGEEYHQLTHKGRKVLHDRQLI
jgi:hypothetical protein